MNIFDLFNQIINNMLKWEEERHPHQELAYEKAERIKSKYLYKIFLIIKYLPASLILLEILYTILSYFNVEAEIISFIGGSSIIYLGLLYLIAKIFRYCYLYKIQLGSILLVNLIAWYDSIYGIPISDINIVRLYLIILLIGLIAFIKFIYNASHNKKSTSQSS